MGLRRPASSRLSTYSQRAGERQDRRSIFPPMKRLIVFGAATAMTFLAVRPHSPAHAQLDPLSHVRVVTRGTREPAHTTWDSIYTDSQATRGDSLYRATCVRCHGETLAGTDSAVSRSE